MIVTIIPQYHPKYANYYCDNHFHNTTLTWNSLTLYKSIDVTTITDNYVLKHSAWIATDGYYVCNTPTHILRENVSQ